MTNQTRSPNEPGYGRFLALIVISLGALAACWWAAGISLGLFIGGLFVATFLIPAGVLEMGNLPKAIGGLAAVVAPIAMFWILPVLKGADTPGQWVQSIIVLIAYSGTIGGIALLLTRVGSLVIFSAAAAIVIGVAWLTWPIWLSPILVKNGSGGIIQDLVSISSPLTINGILTREPAWTERSIAYHLTNLNQDVPIQLPTSVRTCAAVHGIAAIVLWFAASFGRKQKSSPGRFENPDEALTVRPDG
jgi:hypothetical protein